MLAKPGLKSISCVCAVLWLSTITFSQQVCKPISKDDLIRSFELGRRQRKTAKDYVELLNRCHVNFTLTPKDEQDIRRKGKYLGDKGLDDLVAAIRNNRPTDLIKPPPSTSSPVPQASPSPPNSALLITPTPEQKAKCSPETLIGLELAPDPLPTGFTYGLTIAAARDCEFYHRYAEDLIRFKAKLLFARDTARVVLVVYLPFLPSLTNGQNVTLDAVLYVIEHFEVITAALIADFKSRVDIQSVDLSRSLLINHKSILNAIQRQGVEKYAKEKGLFLDLRGPRQ
jgi:hypothetical protein